MQFPPHFRASIRIHTLEEGGPKAGFFGFSDSGDRRLPLATPAVPNYTTVQIRHEANRRVPCGESFEADCRLIQEEPFVDILRAGSAIELWDGRTIASGEVLEVYCENWDAEWASGE